jgi:hypothetical protein
MGKLKFIERHDTKHELYFAINKYDPQKLCVYNVLYHHPVTQNLIESVEIHNWKNEKEASTFIKFLEYKTLEYIQLTETDKSLFKHLFKLNVFFKVDKEEKDYNILILRPFDFDGQGKEFNKINIKFSYKDGKDKRTDNYYILNITITSENDWISNGLDL